MFEGTDSYLYYVFQQVSMLFKRVSMFWLAHSKMFRMEDTFPVFVTIFGQLDSSCVVVSTTGPCCCWAGFSPARTA